MIMKEKCNICGEVLRCNGLYKMCRIKQEHLKEKHPKENKKYWEIYREISRIEREVIGKLQKDLEYFKEIE